MIVRLEPPPRERFTVRWHKGNHRRPGYAVFDGERRITVTFDNREEALRHRDRIAEIYARHGW